MKAATYAGLPGLAEPDTPGANPLSLCRTRARRRTVRSGHPPHNGQLARAVFPSMAPLSGIESTRRCHRGETRLAADAPEARQAVPARPRTEQYCHIEGICRPGPTFISRGGG